MHIKQSCYLGLTIWAMNSKEMGNKIILLQKYFSIFAPVV